MSKRPARGLKHKCQNDECDTSFYDLNREEFDCPICGTAFDHEAHAASLVQQRGAVPDYIRRRQATVLPIVSTADAAERSANDNQSVGEDDASNDKSVADNDTTDTAAADILLEVDEDDQDTLTDAVPLSDADDEEQ